MRFIATAGMLTAGDQLPTTAGLPELSTVTLIGLAVAFRPAESYAIADKVCVPAIAADVSHVIE
jgi:hypothetical protein